LVLQTAAGALRWQRPALYQECPPGARERREPVAGGYQMLAGGQVGFRVGAYDRRRPLVIDPVLDYSTYLGGTGADDGLSIAIDSANSAYVTGSTFSTDFPRVGAFQASRKGFSDVFVSKLNPSGSALVYSTYLGGNDFDFGTSIAVDGAGSACVGGTTESTD